MALLSFRLSSAVDNFILNFGIIGDLRVFNFFALSSLLGNRISSLVSVDNSLLSSFNFLVNFECKWVALHPALELFFHKFVFKSVAWSMVLFNDLQQERRRDELVIEDFSLGE